MRESQRRWRFGPLAVAVSTLIVAAAYYFEPAAAERKLDRDLATVNPAEVGISPERLERLDAGMQKMVDDGQLAGVVTMLARYGKVAFVDVAGMQNIGTGAPMRRDSIFRIYSMSKPITGVAMMMLFEEGKWRLNDPVSKYIPAFADLKVHVGGRPSGSLRLEDARRSMTMRELMSHSAGLAYGLRRDNAVDRLYREERVLNANASLQTMVDKLATLPLLAQPGTRWYYSIAVDVQGYLVEQLSGLALDQFLQERIFEPLGMVDTAFYVPIDKLDRVALIYTKGDNGTLEGADMGETRTALPAGPSGGGGLWGTADDYLRFTQMMLNGGELGGVRLLAPRTVEMMRTNHLSDEATAAMGRPNNGVTARPGTGFGLDFAVVDDPAAAGEPYATGAYYWGGAAGTWFWIDPETDLTFVGMIQHRGSAVRDVQGLSRNLVYQAVVAP